MSDDNEEEMLELVEMDDISFLKKNRDALTQSIAERVCEALARELYEEAFRTQGYVLSDLARANTLYEVNGLIRARHIITRPRDWAKELEGKK